MNIKLTSIVVLLLALSLGQAQAAIPYAPEKGVIGGSVARATFTSRIVNFEPVDRFETRKNNKPYVFFFTDLKGMTGQRVTHRWVYKGKVVVEKHFDVGAPKWRVWSAVVLPPHNTGDWVVYVLNGLNEVVLEQHLNYVDCAMTMALPAQTTRNPSRTDFLPL